MPVSPGPLLMPVTAVAGRVSLVMMNGFYVDLGEPAEIATIALNWEAAHAKSYKLLISDDAAHWKEIYSNEDCKGGLEEIKIKPVRTAM